MCLEVVLESVESADQLAGSQEMGGRLGSRILLRDYFATPLPSEGVGELLSDTFSTGR